MKCIAVHHPNLIARYAARKKQGERFIRVGVGESNLSVLLCSSGKKCEQMAKIAYKLKSCMSQAFRVAA